MLAVVLLGFSTVLYWLADQYLHRQSQERLDSVLRTLSAAFDIGTEGVEWEPAARHINLETPAYTDPVVWIIGDHRGDVVDQSKAAGTDQFLDQVSPSLLPSNHDVVYRQGTWNIGQRWVKGIGEKANAIDMTEEGDKYPMLSITAGVSLVPVHTTLRRLGVCLAGLSLAIWITALFLGRFICRRALLPLRKMAAIASEMQTSDLTGRLPVLTSRDELEDLGRAFNSLLDRVQQTFERQSRFTGDASHQLRTPLTAILGQIDVALRKERTNEEYQRVLSTVQSKAHRLSRIVESLLFLARADSDAPEPRLEQLDFGSWLPTYFESWKDHERANDITLENHCSGTCMITVEPELFRELLDILLDNACKYSPPGTAIQVRLESSDSHVAIHVVDNGYGIAESDLPNLFVPFVRSDESRLKGIEGIGLGLSIAKRLTAVFKGELTVTSRKNVETCFTVKLPCGR